LTLDLLHGDRILALSTDTKPQALGKHQWTLEEIDTGRLWLWDENAWIQSGHTAEVAGQISEGQPIIRLIGDEFASTRESSMYLLDGLTSSVGGTALVNNGTITFTTIDNDIPLRGHIVPTLDGATQYFSLPTEASVEVGTGSFIAKIDFKIIQKDTADTLISYGSDETNEQRWNLEIASSNILRLTIDDGTNAVTISDPVAKRWQDGKWHTAEMFIDRTLDIGYLIVDGQTVASASISTVTLTLDNVGEDLRIGAFKNATPIITNFYTGEVSNFHLIKAADYNALAVLNQGIREPILQGNGVTLNTETTARLNNLFANAAAESDGDYFQTVIDVEEGEYEIQQIYERNTLNAIMELKIDNEVISSTDTFNGSQDFNNEKITTGVKLSKGKHLLKMEVNGRNGSATDFIISQQFINIIKREGHENGGATKFLLLGDEIIQRFDDVNMTDRIASTTRVYNNAMGAATASLNDGDFTEGDIFLKGGIYSIEYIHFGNTNQGLHSLDFGNVKVLDKILATTSNDNVVVKRRVRWMTVDIDGSDLGHIVASVRGERVSD